MGLSNTRNINKRDSYRAAYSENAIDGGVLYRILIDLSDTTSYPHNDTNYIVLRHVKTVVDRSTSTSVGKVMIGVITRIDATDADIEYPMQLIFNKADTRRVMSISNLEPFLLNLRTDSGKWTEGITNNKQTTTSVNTGITLDSTTGSPVTPAVGDLIMRVSESGTGDYDLSVEVDYHTE